MYPRALTTTGILACTVFLCLSATAVAGERTAREKVLDQRVLEMKASELEPAAGRDIDRLSVVVWNGDSFEPVPFQIDEMGQANLVWFDDSGLDGPENAGVFSDRDRLLTLFADAAGQAPEDASLDEGELLAEVALEDEGRETRFLYLALDHEPRSDRRYVEHDFDTGVTETDAYRLEVDPDNELRWEHLGFKGYRGEGSIIDSLHMRMSAGVFFSGARVTLDERNLRPDTYGTRVGPIRSVTHVRTRVVIAGVTVMRLHIQAYRYPQHFEAHSYAELPGLYRATLRDPVVEVALRGRGLDGAVLRTARSGDVTGQIDGSLGESDRALIDRGLTTDESWIYFDSGRDFTLLTELDVPEKLAGIPLDLVFRDDEEPGPLVGYALKGWPPEKELRFTQRMLFDSGLEGLDPPEYARLRTSRPEIRASAF